MPDTCPECGARLAGSDTCQAMFESLLALEFTKPDYGEVHFLTVACFMIQHGRYSNEALGWIAPRLRSFLEHGELPTEDRRKMRAEADQTLRRWKVTRQPGAKPLAIIAWSMTIADVASSYFDAQSYCELVRKWAATTYREMKPYLS